MLLKNSLKNQASVIIAAENSDVLFLVGHFSCYDLVKVPEDLSPICFQGKPLGIIMTVKNRDSNFGPFNELSHIALMSKGAGPNFDSKNIINFTSNLLSLLKIVGQNHVKAFVYQAWADNSKVLTAAKEHLFDQKAPGDIDLPDNIEISDIFDSELLKSKLDCSEYNYTIELTKEKKYFPSFFTFNLETLAQNTDGLTSFITQLNFSKVAVMGSKQDLNLQGTNDFFKPLFYMTAKAKNIKKITAS